jgi:SpoVK/Ycf46/Vps4 family AAA+-type ATPase
MSDRDAGLLAALGQALERDPKNGPLWLHFADLLAQAGRTADAITALRMAAEQAAEKREAIRRMVPLLRATGQLAEALVRAETTLEGEDDPALRREYARILLARGETREALHEYNRALAADPSLADAELEALRGGSDPRPATHDQRPRQSATGLPAQPGHPQSAMEDAPFRLGDWEPEAEDGRARAEVTPQPVEAEELVGPLVLSDLYVTFADVAGLEDVKNQIHLRIIAPFKQPEIYRAFRRAGGGGILLYGPPGCGKTFIARATAGECGARFMSIGIHEIIDQYWGQSEKLIHALFDEARRRAPTVLFFDEFDALGSSRGRSESQFWKTLVDQLLQEMDGMSGRNDDVLVFAATNVPWNVDAAFRRPGRFDRVLLVPPPDEPARAAILRRHAEKLPGGSALNLDRLAQATALMTGADLKALCERASERALSRSLETGKVHPVTQEDFERELKQVQSSASEWLATARNYARYSNEGGQYDELVEFLKRVKRW